MKKSLFLLILISFAVVSCKKEVPAPIVPVIQNRQVIDLQADNNNWVANNGAYYASFDIPELTRDAYDNALVLCYAEFNTGTTNAYQEQLPFIYFDQSTDQETGEVFNWSRLLDFDYTVGSMTIYYTNNDFNYLSDEPGSWHFRLVIVW